MLRGFLSISFIQLFIRFLQPLYHRWVIGIHHFIVPIASPLLPGYQRQQALLRLGAVLAGKRRYIHAVFGGKGRKGIPERLGVFVLLIQPGGGVAGGKIAAMTDIIAIGKIVHRIGGVQLGISV